jgi:hypothetical protein
MENENTIYKIAVKLHTLLKEGLMFSQCLKTSIIYLKEPKHKN